MLILLTSLGALFLASLAAYLLTRLNNPQWEGVHFGLPWGLMLATASLALTSWQLEQALRAIRRNNQQMLARHLKLSGAAAFAFLGVQAFNWVDLQTLNPSQQSHILALFSFYMLTGLHAIHVLGGFVPLAVVLRQASQREYSSSRYEGVRLLAQYWHFLGGVWLVLLACLLVG